MPPTLDLIFSGALPFLPSFFLYLYIALLIWSIWVSAVSEYLPVSSYLHLFVCTSGAAVECALPLLMV